MIPEPLRVKLPSYRPLDKIADRPPENRITSTDLDPLNQDLLALERGINNLPFFPPYLIISESSTAVEEGFEEADEWVEVIASDPGPVKVHRWTDLEVELFCTWRVSDAETTNEARLRIELDGSGNLEQIVPLGSMLFSQADVRTPYFHHAIRVSGIPDATVLPVHFEVQHLGTGVGIIDDFDQLRVIVREVVPPPPRPAG